MTVQPDMTTVGVKGLTMLYIYFHIHWSAILVSVILQKYVPGTARI